MCGSAVCAFWMKILPFGHPPQMFEIAVGSFVNSMMLDVGIAGYHVAAFPTVAAVVQAVRTQNH